MTIHTFELRNAIMKPLNTIPEIEKDNRDTMDWEWTPDPKPVANLATNLENKIRKGKIKLTPAKDPADEANRAARSRRGGTVPPPTPKGSLGFSQNTGRK